MWTHLTGTYQVSTNEVRLYVDGALQQTVGVVTNGFDAAGELWIGSRRHNGAKVEPWQGQLADVGVWSRAITPDETAAQVKVDSASAVGAWKFDEAQGTIAKDSVFWHDLTLTLGRGAGWGQGLNGVGSSLRLDGTGSADSDETVLNTDQSFSIEAWARLAEAGAERTVVVQRGPFLVDPFALKYDGTKWMVEMPNAATDPTAWWRVVSRTNAAVDDWTQLKVSYDAAAGTLSLWVDDVLQGTTAGVKAWKSDGLLSVGSGSRGQYWFGDIDDLKVYQGVLTPVPLNTAAPDGASVSGDANAEIISVDANGAVRSFLNEGGAYPGLPQQIGSGWTAERTRFADLDADGRTEIIALDPDGAIRAFHNVNGMNGFPFGAVHTIGWQSSTDPSRTQFADIDGDGRADRVSIDPDGRIRVYRNLFGLNQLGQTRAFATAPVIVKVTSLSHDRIRFADIDGDRKAELVTINEDQTVSGFQNTGRLGQDTYEEYREIGFGWTPDRTWFANISGERREEIITVRPDGAVWSYPNANQPPAIPFGAGTQIGSGWHEPARVFFS